MALASFEDDINIEGRIYELKVDGVNVCYGLAPTPNGVAERKTIVLSHEHRYGEIEDCTKDTLCTMCGQIAIEAKESHEAACKQSSCLEAVKCKNCKQNAIEAKASHSYGTIIDCTVAIVSRMR